MSIQRGIMYAQMSYASVQYEATMRELAATANGMTTFRSGLLTFYYKGLEKHKKDGNAIVHFSVSSQDKPNVFYDVYIEMIPQGGGTLFSRAQDRIRPAQKIALLRECDVKVFCSCEWFNYGGMKYNMKHIYDGFCDNGYVSVAGVPNGGEDIDPKERDPMHKNHVCKHLVAAFKAVMTNWNRIMADAKRFKVDEHEDVDVFPEDDDTQSGSNKTQTDDDASVISELAGASTIGKDDGMQLMNGTEKDNGKPLKLF